LQKVKEILPHLELVLPDRELYLNSPEEIPEEELMTEIQFPIKGE